MAIKKLLGSFFIALIISTFISIGQSSVFAACPDVKLEINGKYTDSNGLSTVQYTVSQPLPGSSSLADCNKYTIMYQDPITNANKTIAIDLTNSGISKDGMRTYSSTVTLIDGQKYGFGVFNDKTNQQVEYVGDVLNRAPNVSAPPVGSGYGTNYSNNTWGGGTATAATSELTKSVSQIFVFVFPIALIIAILRILIAIIQITTSEGNPDKLSKAKDMLLSTILGLLVIGGAVTIINVLGGALGI